MDYQKELEFAVELAKEAAVIMKKYFTSDNIGTIFKEDKTPLTAADTAINAMVIDRVKATFPDCGVVGEEGSFEDNRNKVWIVDPIDGTLPYSSGIAVSTFCLAFVIDGSVKVGVVYEALGGNSMFTAVEGQGAFMNEKRIQVSEVTNFSDTLTAFGADKLNKVKTELNSRGSKNLWFHSFAFSAAKVADGTFLASGMRYGSPWDAAAVSLIAQEAGGKVTDIEGQTRKFNEWGNGILISNGKLHEEIVRLIADEYSRD